MAPPTLSSAWITGASHWRECARASCRSASFTPPIEMNFSSPPDAVVIGMGRSSRAPASDYARAIDTLLDAGLEYRRFGAGALMLAHVAAGQLHAYYEAHMNSWDALAGMLLIEEAGGTCNAFLANAGLRRGNLVLAGCASVQPRLAALLAK